ncbi:MAG: aspartate aminotransferase family protein [bacterium]
MNHVFPRHTKSNQPLAVAGQGCYLVDQTGKQYLDGSGGAAVSCLGHGDDEITSKIDEQLQKLAFAHTGFFTSEPAEKLADLLIQHAPGSLDRVYFVSGGSEAVEAAIKLARQYFLEKGEGSRYKVIARHQSYHGNTLGALAAGGNMWRRKPFEPLMAETSHICPCYAYREQWEGESDVDYGLRAANALEQEILRNGAEHVMAFIAEPVVGATLGAVPAAQGYFRRIREICDHYGVLLILDEVMCGMGRTGTLYACEQDGIAPDIMTIAKGLGAGYQPIGAMLCSNEIYSEIEQGSGFFQHGHTYLGHPVACAAGHAVVSAILERELVERCRQQGEKLDNLLRERFSEHPYIGDIRGRGLFRGLELVRNRESKEPFDPFLEVNKKLKRAAFEAGLICYPMGGTIDGQKGDHVLLAPPFIIEDQQLGELVDKISLAVDAATEG